MKTLLKYAAGGILTLTSITYLSFGIYGIIGAVLMLVAAFVCFPPLLKILENKTGIILLPAMKYIVVVACSILGFLFITNSPDYVAFHKKQSELAVIEKTQEAYKDSVDNIANNRKKEVDIISSKQEGRIEQNEDHKGGVSDFVEIGEIGRIVEPCIGAISKDVNSEINKISINHDYEAIEEFIRAGQALPLEKNTKVRVTGGGWGYKKIRILYFL